MKKILFLLTLFALSFVVADAQTAFSQSTFNPTGAILNTSSDTMTYTFVTPRAIYSVQPVYIKGTGTPAGTMTLQLSVNGIDYVASGDVLTVTDVARKTIIWHLQKPVKKLRIITTGATTVTATTAATVIQGN